jgi:aminopeptidase N
VGWATYRDQWLSEGFADFSAGLFLQFIEKKQDQYLKYWERQQEQITKKNQWGFSANDAGPVWLGIRLDTFKTPQAYNAVVYPKGGFILHMLRYLMMDPKTGDTDFIAMMKDFVQTYRGQNVSSEGFQDVVEKHMKQQMDVDGNGKMGWFFGQWLYTTQIPSYRFEYSLTPADDGKAVLTGKFYQGGVPKGFHMPAWLYLDFDNGGLVRVGKMVVDGESSKDIKITLPKKPKRVLLNAFHDVLVTSQEVKQVN